MKKLSILLFTAVFLCSLAGCQNKPANPSSATTTETRKEDQMPSVTKKELSSIKNTAAKKFKKVRNYDIEKVVFPPEDYKKMGYDTWKEFVDEHTADGDIQKYSANKIIILQGYEDGSTVTDVAVFAKVKGKWKFLYLFK